MGVYATEPYRDQRTILSFYYLDSWNLSSAQLSLPTAHVPLLLGDNEWHAASFRLWQKVTGSLVIYSIGPLTMNELVRIRD